MSVREIYDKIDNKLIVELKEDRRLEWKSSGIHAKALGNYFSIFSNTPPDGGIICIGVENDGTITGCNSTPTKLINELERSGDIYCHNAQYDFKTINVINKYNKPNHIIVFLVKYREDLVVETTDGNAFIRRGESRRKLSDDEKRELRNEKGQLDVERESVRLDFPSDFKPTLSTNLLQACETSGAYHHRF